MCKHRGIHGLRVTSWDLISYDVVCIPHRQSQRPEPSTMIPEDWRNVQHNTTIHCYRATHTPHHHADHPSLRFPPRLRTYRHPKTDAGKADLALEVRRARAAAAQSNISMRGASPAERKLESVLDVFNSYDLDGSGTIDVRT